MACRILQAQCVAALVQEADWEPKTREGYYEAATDSRLLPRISPRDSTPVHLSKLAEVDHRGADS